MAPTRADAEQAFENFVEIYEAKYPRAVECLKEDRTALLTVLCTQQSCGPECHNDDAADDRLAG